MPGTVLEKLTGSYDDFDKAEAILFNYYELPEYKEELIIDAFKIMGSVNCLELLNSLNLSTEDGIPEANPAWVSSMQAARFTCTWIKESIWWPTPP